MPLSKEKGSFRVFFFLPSGSLDTSIKRICHCHFPFMNRIQNADATKFQLCRKKKKKLCSFSTVLAVESADTCRYVVTCSLEGYSEKSIQEMH